MLYAIVSTKGMVTDGILAAHHPGLLRRGGNREEVLLMPKKNHRTPHPSPPTPLLQHPVPLIKSPGMWCHQHGVFECVMITDIDTANPENHNPNPCHAFPAPGLEVCVEHKDLPLPSRKGFFGNAS